MGTPAGRPGYGSHDAVATRRLLQLFGLAARSGTLISGTEAVRAAARDGKLRRAIIAGDSSPTQRKKLEPLLDARSVPYHTILSQAELGLAIGKPPVTAIGLADVNLARRAGELLASIPTRRGAARPGGSSQQE